jgi:hypothetical protein
MQPELTGNRKQPELVWSMVLGGVESGGADRVTVGFLREASLGEHYSHAGQHQFGASQEKAGRKVGRLSQGRGLL